MPGKTLWVKFREFFGGLNTRKEAYLLTPGEAQAAKDVDMFTGALAGTPDVGAAVTVDANYPNADFIHFLGAGNKPNAGAWAAAGLWKWANERRWALRDGDLTYMTVAGGRPQSLDTAGNSLPLGIVPLSGVAWTLAAGSLAAVHAYGFSYELFDGHTSNIQNFLLSFDFPTLGQGKVSFTVTWPTDSRVAKIQLWRATVTAGVVGAYYKVPTGGATIGSLTNRASTSLVDDGTQSLGTATANLLIWTYGGSPLNASAAGNYTADHAPAPVLTRLSDRIHAMAAGLSSASSLGITIGALGNVLRWSVNGEPLYWPTLNNATLDRDIEAVVADTGFAAIFTGAGTYAFAGNQDSAMAIRPLDARHPIRPGWGKSCVRTSCGTIFVSYDGLAIFDGATTRIISAQKLPRSYFDTLTCHDAGFYGEKYKLFMADRQLHVDLRDGWEQARFSTSDTVVRCAAFADFRTPLVGTPERDIPTTGVTTSAVGLRRMGFCSDNANKLYLVGGNRIDTTVNPGGEVSTTYSCVLDTSSASAIWASAGNLPGQDGRCDHRAVYVDGKIYCYGGQKVTTGAHYNDMQVLTVPSTWATNSAAGPGAIRAYAAAADTTGANTTQWWLHGGAATPSVMKSDLFVFGIATATWSDAITGGPALSGHAMAYVPGAPFDDAKPRLFLFAGSTDDTATNAKNIVYARNLTDSSWADDTNSEGTGISSGQAAGVGARYRHGWAYDAVSKRIFLHGGFGTDGSGLADLWEFDPVVWARAAALGSGVSRSNAWVNVAGDVVGVEDRGRHGVAFAGNSGTAGEKLYLAGGTSDLNRFEHSLFSVYVSALESHQTSPGLYVLKNSDGGNIRQLEAGVAQPWSWRTPDVIGEDPTTVKHACRVKVDYIGDVNLSVFNDNAAVLSIATLSSATRAQDERLLPLGTGASRGKRLSWQFSGACISTAASNIAGILYSAEFELDEEPQLGLGGGA